MLYHPQLQMANVNEPREADALRPIGGYRSVQDLVLDRLRDAILSGDLPPGTRLKLRDLAAQLGVSPMPVQESLHVLEIEGLAVREPRRGVVVSALTPESVGNAFQMVAAVAGLCVRHAATRLTPDDLATLRAMVAEMEVLRASGRHRELLLANRRFHGRICAAYPNQWAHDTLRRLWNHAYRVEGPYPRSETRWAQSEGEHRAILSALEARNATEAARLVEAHAEASGAELVRQMLAAERARRATSPTEDEEEGNG
jgi:DNA-binding GntR family transcriptional regulator